MPQKTLELSELKRSPENVSAISVVRPLEDQEGYEEFREEFPELSIFNDPKLIVVTKFIGAKAIEKYGSNRAYEKVQEATKKLGPETLFRIGNIRFPNNTDRNLAVAEPIKYIRILIEKELAIIDSDLDLDKKLKLEPPALAKLPIGWQEGREIDEFNDYISKNERIKLVFGDPEIFLFPALRTPVQ